ncbi:hypothetical protein D3C78_1919720 [compost metagenome]
MLSLEKIFGKKPLSAEDLNTWAMVNCQPSSEPTQDMIIRAIMILPTVGLNMWENASPNGAVELARSIFGTIPAMTLVETI